MLGPLVLDLQGKSLTPEERSVLANPYVGGVIFFSRNFQSVEQMAQLIADIRGVRSELVLCVDQEGGRVQRFRNGFSRLPSLQKIGKLYQQNSVKGLFAAHKLGWLMAAELRAIDIDISFAPVVDVDEHFSDVIGDRSFSDDVATVVALGKAYIRGMTDAGMTATLKHFPGHGAIKADSHHALPVDFREYDEVCATDLVPFTQLLPLAGAVMPAHIRFPLIDEQSVGFSPYWLQTVLRQKLSFNGVIFSDDLSMEGASIVGDHVARAEAALAAGCDAILVCNAPAKAQDVLMWLEREQWPIADTLSALRSSKPLMTPDMAALQASAAWQEAGKLLQKVEESDAAK